MGTDEWSASLAGKSRRWEGLEVGIRTRRRPIGQDYAAARDAEVGKIK
jgi:hypothetical protein